MNFSPNKQIAFLLNILVLFSLLVTFLTGCGAFVRVVELDDETAKNLRQEIKYYEPSQLNSLTYETIQPIEATSCKNKLWDPSPSRENAIDQLRYIAKSYGGNGIANIYCGGSEGTTLSKNCWNSIVCNGMAIKVTSGTKSTKELVSSISDNSLGKETSFVNIKIIPDFKAAPRTADFAVIIGIEHYQSLPSADYSISDASIVREYLRALGYQDRNIEFLTDERATKSGIEKTIEAWIPNRVKKDSTVFVYYSGHGSPDPATGEANLVPYDGDLNYLSFTGYPISRLYEKLGKLQAKEVIIVIDSCFSGSGGRSVIAKGTRPIVLVLSSTFLNKNMAVLTATQGMQISTSSPEKKNGLLTYHFLKAIKDGKSDLSEIYDLIKPQIENEAKVYNVQQSPSLMPASETIKGKFNLKRD